MDRGKWEIKKKALLISVFILALLFLPRGVNAQSGGEGGKAAPIAQALVREGDFAVRLTETLKLGTTDDEVEAEDILAGAGIEPQNGWISDYPITPDIVGEIEEAVAAAADAGELGMERDEALKAVRVLAARLGLPVISADEPYGYAENNPSGNSGGEPPDSSAVNDYYNNAGPPVVTYYSPPVQFYEMYAWVPYPFWCNRFFFPGFFILHKFHKTIIVHKKPFLITNQVINPGTKSVFVIDPTRRFQKIIVTPRSKAFKGTVQGGRFFHHKGIGSPHLRGKGPIPGQSQLGPSTPSNKGGSFPGGFQGGRGGFLGGSSFPRGGCTGRC